METELPRQNWRWTPAAAVAGALVLAGALFLVIPLTQWFDPPAEPDTEVRKVTVAPPPPAPEPPEPPADQPERPPAPAAPDLSESSPELEVAELDVALSPGAGDALAMGAPGASLAADASASEGIERLFTFEDLPQAPRLLNMPSFEFPPGLARRGVEQGRVVVEIDILPSGRARLHRIVSSTHRELEPAARRIVRQARFSKPMIDGKARTVRGRFPLVLQN